MVAYRCRWVRRRLAILAGDHDGRDLRADDRRLMERHVITCSSCRAERDSLTSAVDLLRASATVRVTDPNAPSIWPEVSRQIRRSRHPRPSFGFNLGLLPGLGMAASLLGVGTVIGLIGWSLGSASGSKTYQARVESIPPRPALPPEGPQVADDQPPAKLTLDLDPKSPLHGNAGDPQKSE